ncbi:MAG: hypothetical protein AAF224_12830, partial [Pseudomonadota bacterium]
SATKLSSVSQGMRVALQLWSRGSALENSTNMAQTIHTKVNLLGQPQKILRSFLERPQIYHSNYFFQRLEAQARENLARAINVL